MKGFLLVCVLLGFVVPCSGMEAEEVPGLERVWEQAQSYGIEPDTSLESGLAKLASSALSHIGDLLRDSMSAAPRLLIVVLLCSTVQSVQGEGKGGIQAVELAGAAAVTALTLTDMDSMIGLGRDTIGRVDAFSQILLPVVAVLNAAAGRVTGAAVQQGATMLFSQLLIRLMDKLLLPLVYAYVVVNCVQAVVGNPGLQKLAGFLKGCVTFVLTTVLLSFVSYLVAGGAISGSADAAAIKVTRIAISRAIPVVGSILSDASESILVGAGMLRGTVGVAGLLVVLAICLIPFLRLALQYMVYKITAALCAVIAQPKLSGLIDAIGSAFGLVLGMTGASALILMVSIVSALSMVAL